MGTIGKGKKSSFERSIDGLIKSVEIDYSEDSFVAPREYFYERRDLTLLTVEEKTRDEKVKINGEIEGNGFIYVDEDGNIYIDNICNKDYCANGPDDNIVITPNPDGEVPEHSKTEPVIKLNGDSTIYLGLNESYKELGAIAKTKLGEKLEYQIEIKKDEELVENIDTSSEGTYKVIYTAENDGKKATAIRTVIVLDMTPVITMTEPDGNYVRRQEVLITVSGIKPNVVNEFTYEINGKEEIVKGLNKTVTLTETGEVTIRVTVRDNNGHTNTVSKIYRIDTTGPQIIFEPEVVELESNEALSYDVLTGVRVVDNIDGTIDNARIVIGGDTLLSIPGEYRVRYTVSDRLGNETTRERRYIVRDLTKPEIVITPNGTSRFVKSETVKIEARDNIKVERISYVIIKDGVRGTVNSINNGGSITLNSTGNYQIEVTAVDNSGNTEGKTSGTYKIDTTPPVITFSNVTLKITEVAGYNLMTGVTTSDNSGVTPTLSYTGNLSSILGNQTITYTVTDEAGNTATKIRTFTIVEADGPILNFSNASTNNSWTKGQTITVTATDNSNLSSFTYELIKNNVSQGVRAVTVNGKSASANIALNTDGVYSIRLKGADQHGNSSELNSGIYYIDVTAPTVPTTMEFVYGDCTRYTQGTWSNQTVYALTTCNPLVGPSGSTDSTSGVAKYQISSDNRTWYDYAYDAGNGMYAMIAEGTHTRYFRAVDQAGNVSGSISRTANVDKTGPALNNWWWGETNTDVARLYIQTSDARGISGIQCHASTATGGYGNWVQMGVTWDAGANAYRCDVTPGTFNHYNQTYKVHVYAQDGVGNGAGPWETTVAIPNNGTSGSDLVNKDNLPNVAGGNRYQGPDPNNFVTFNGEAYRIIGVFNGQMKIIYWGSYTTAGQFYKNTAMAWNSGRTNDWSKASLMTEFNTTYWNTISSTYQAMVDQSHVWKLGGWDSSSITRAQMYQYENGTTVYPGRPTTWTGKIALMYPSDYAYATSGGSTCDTTILYDWEESAAKAECAYKSWLHSQSQTQWTLTLRSDNLGSAFAVGTYGRVGANYNNVTSTLGVRPVLFLTSDVKIKSGTGTKTDPYILTK